jgi:hypothetical protein
MWPVAWKDGKARQWILSNARDRAYLIHKYFSDGTVAMAFK